LPSTATSGDKRSFYKPPFGGLWLAGRRQFIFALSASWTSAEGRVSLMEILMEIVNVNITKRDLFIFEFIEACGWVKFDSILKYLIKNNEYIDFGKYSKPMNSESLRVRLNLLYRAGYLRRVRFLDSNYYSSTILSAGRYELVKNLNYNQAEHDDYLINLAIEFSNYKFCEFDTQRMIKSRFTLTEKSGPIPDLIYKSEDNEDAAFIEYERTEKSELQIQNKIYNLLADSKRIFKKSSVVVICETANIYNKYIKVMTNYFNFDSQRNYVCLFQETGRFNIDGTKIYEIQNEMSIICMKSSEVSLKFRQILAKSRTLYKKRNPE
jgi:hypothetical protein